MISENNNKGNIDKSLAFKSKNHLLPGKLLTPKQLTQLIESSRKSGMISMQEAHHKIRNSFIDFKS